MADKIDGGPPPFVFERGAMSLRDYFAGQALVGLVAHPHSGMEDAEKLSGWAFQIADAMLARRGERSG